MNTKPIHLGLIGTGQRLLNVIHKVLDASGRQIQVEAIYDPDPISQAAAQAALGTPLTLCSSEDELVERSSVDWVFIGSPNAHHPRQSIKALQAGKNVFCEKPLGTDLNECRQVRDAVRESGRTFAFGLVLRYSPHYQKIREVVQSGALGRLISFEFNETLDFNLGGYIFGNWRRHRDVAGPFLLEKCCHDLDLANWILSSRPVRAASFGGRDFYVPSEEKNIARIGPNTEGRPAYQTLADPHRVNPFLGDADIVDNQIAILEYENGARGTFHTNANAGIPERRFYFCGSEGSLRGDACSGIIEWKRIGHETTVERFETPCDHHAGGDDMMARGLVDTLMHNKPPLATVDDGILSCITAIGIDHALQDGKVINLNSLYQKYL